MSLNFLATRFQCTWPWSTLVMLCDGRIVCTQACCAPETGITRTRQAGMLDFDLFKRVIDEAGPSLVRIDFFNYGEAFLHKRAVEMCEYIKTNFPHIYLYTSTNGLALNEAQARRLVHSGIRGV